MRKTRILVALTTVLTLVNSVMAQESVAYRLPPEIQPSSQTIELNIDPAEIEYFGRTTIQLSITERTDRIGIYQIGLDLSAISLSINGESRPLDEREGAFDISWLSDGHEIAAGDYELRIAFSGKHWTDSLGMHHVKFEDNDYLFTQFEDMYGRRAIPLFDEPSFKIPYQLIINAPAGHTVVSNTPVESLVEKDGLQRVTFMQTRPMPSYLIAYAVGPLERVPIEGMSIPGFVYAPKGHTDELGLVLRETPRIVAALENYFDIKYPYRKLDFLAVPEFSFGAMENVGLITYRTDLLLVGDEASGSVAESVVSVIAHEVAHIWFGDLVTMEWWDDLWLNEGFATWMARSILVSTYPQFEADLKLPQSRALRADQRISTRAIRRTIRNSKDVIEDLGLNYSKGHAILRMMENYVGHDVWQRGIRKYLHQYSWGNATESDLWAVISEESGLDVSRIASDWLNQPGFAKLTIDEHGSVTQQRYLTVGSEAPDLQWQIPLNIKYKKDNEIREAFYLLERKSGSIDMPEGADWIFPDAGGNGYFRWQTDLRQFHNLIDDLEALTHREKIALLDNSEALLNSGDLSLADYLYVLDRLLAETHPLVIRPALEKLKQIGDDFIEPGDTESFARFVDQKLARLFADVGVMKQAEDTDGMLQMRPRLLRVLGQFGADPLARELAGSIADLYLADANSTDPDLGREALRVAALADDGGRYDQYLDTYLKSDSARQKSNILGSFYFDNPEVVRKYLDFMISPDVPAGDAHRGLGGLTTVRADHTILYKWLDENLDQLESKIPAYRHNVLPQVMVGICNNTNLALLEKFFGGRGDKYAVSLRKAVETVEVCMRRKQREHDALVRFLARYDE